MEFEPFEVNENISRMSDEELLRVVREDASQYRPEALEFARSELERRGLVLFPEPKQAQCGKCGSRMEEGFIPDFGHLQFVQPVTWVEGKPEASFWKGTRIGDKRQIDVAAFRCTSCGLVEFYAVEAEE